MGEVVLVEEKISKSCFLAFYGRVSDVIPNSQHPQQLQLVQILIISGRQEFMMASDNGSCDVIIEWIMTSYMPAGRIHESHIPTDTNVAKLGACVERKKTVFST